jgi:hypothetical protein
MGLPFGDRLGLLIVVLPGPTRFAAAAGVADYSYRQPNYNNVCTDRVMPTAFAYVVTA